MSPASRSPVLRQRWAMMLGVETPQSPANWLLRVFVLPQAAADTGRRAPAWLARLAQHLGVANPQDEMEWLLRLLVLPAPRPGTAARSPGPALRWLGTVLSLPLALAERWDKRVAALPWERPAMALERAATIAMDNGALARGLIAALAAAAVLLSASVPLSDGGQLAYALLLWLTASLLRRVPGRLAATVMVSLSALASLRYGSWRIASTLEVEFGLAALLGYGLLAAECCFYLVLSQEFARYLRSAPAVTSGGSQLATDFCRAFARAAFVCAPLAYLLFELPVVAAPASTLALYALPHLLVAGLARSRLQSDVRHPVRAALEDAALAWLAPGGAADGEGLRLGRAGLAVLGLTLAGWAAGLARWLMDSDDNGMLALNLAWASVNLAILGTAAFLARASRRKWNAWRAA